MKRRMSKTGLAVSKSVVTLLITALLGINLVSCDSQQRQPWYIYAKEYIKADQNIRENASRNDTSFSTNYDLRHQAEINLLAASAPSQKELQQLLSSNDNLLQKIALVVMRVKNINDDRIFATIIENYSHANDSYIKYYSLQCLKQLRDDQIKTLEGSVLRLIAGEKDESMIVNALPLLIRLDPDKVRPLLAEYLVSGGVGLRRAAFILMKTENETLCKSVVDQLEKNNKTEALKFIRQLEETHSTSKKAR